MQTVSLELHPVRHADVFNMLTSGLLPLFINESFGDPAFSCAAALRRPLRRRDEPRCTPRVAGVPKGYLRYPGGFQKQVRLHPPGRMGDQTLCSVARGGVALAHSRVALARGGWHWPDRTL